MISRIRLPVYEPEFCCLSVCISISTSIFLLSYFYGSYHCYRLHLWHVGLAPLAYGYWTHLKTADPLRLNCPHRLCSFWF